MNTALPISEFLGLSRHGHIIDVRSPGEFEAGHIPGAVNIPLFSDEERARVGIAYKREGKDKAVEIGYEVVNPKRTSFIDQIKKIQSEKKTATPHHDRVLVHCWRGGMRSEKFAAFLNEHGFETHTLDKGYKAYRNFVLRTFTGDYNFILLGGETGSGKTDILKKMIEKGAGVVDLEGLAQHKGSAFGSLGESAQPSQEQFENNLANELLRLSSGSDIIWLEDESRSIGTCQLPNPIWDKMKAAPIVRVNIPHEARIERLLNDYGNFPKESLGSSILRIKKRLGPQHAKSAMEALEAGNLRAVTELVLTYYDKAYNHCHELRNYRDIHVVECASADAAKNADQVLEFTRHQLTQPNA